MQEDRKAERLRYRRYREALGMNAERQADTDEPIPVESARFNLWLEEQERRLAELNSIQCMFLRTKNLELLNIFVSRDKFILDSLQERIEGR